MVRALMTVLLLALAVPLSGCIVVDRGHPHGCAYHPGPCF